MKFCTINLTRYIKELECSFDNHQLYDSVPSIRPIEDKRLIIEISLIRKRERGKENQLD